MASIVRTIQRNAESFGWSTNEGVSIKGKHHLYLCPYLQFLACLT